MLTLTSPRSPGSRSRGGRPISRRAFLQIGTLALGGLTLGDLLRRRAAAAPAGVAAQPRQKSAILIHLSGGPSHLDMYDMKPLAPIEYRGEFAAIATNVPGIEVCELMPRQAKIADKFAILRGAQIANLHTGNMFYSGYPWQESPRASVPGEARRPAVGSVVSRLRPSPRMPTYVSIENHFDWERAYYAGLEHEPLRVGQSNPGEVIENLGRNRQITIERLTDRRTLLAALDDVRRQGAQLAALDDDHFRARAFEIIGSTAVRDAFDLKQETPEARARYGEGKYRHGPHPGPSLLLARRLIEAGAGVVTVGVHGWDTHAHNFPALREMLPPLDQALHALVTDLDERGLLDDVVIVMGGEFGRTPRIGDQTPDGRGHWPEAGFIWLAGGGLHTGQAIGATDGRGEQIIGNPIGMQSVLATVYHQLGIHPSTTIDDYNGRPQVLLDETSPIAGLV